MSHSVRGNRVLAFAALVCVLVLCQVAAVAQSTTDGAIAGVVTDPSGAVIPGAKVVVRNVGTNAESVVETNAEGRFRAAHLQPGSYSVAVEVAGFAAHRRSNVIVEVGRATEMSIGLSAAGREETVEVTGEAPVVNTTQQDFSSNVNQVSINELPINGRRWSNFALLTPGATPDGDFGLISFRGISGLLNNNTVDGGDNNQAFFSEERGRTRIGYVISQSAVREFQVNASNYSAEYGRSAGGVVNAVTKSGTNDLHGQLFYHQRNNKWGAYNPFTKQAVNQNGSWVTVPVKPKDIRHQFGGAVGGPIIKDRLFFFFSYDEQQRNFPGVALPGNPNTFFAPIAVSDPAARTTNPVQCRTSSGAFTSGLSEGERLFCQGISQAQVDQGLTYLVGLTGVVPRRGDQRIIFPKLDWQITQNHRLSAGWNHLRWDSPAGVQTQPVVSRGIASFGDDFVDVDTVNVKLSSVFTNTLTNELRLHGGRDHEYQNSQPPAPGEPTTGPGGLPPSVSISSTAGITVGKPNFLERRSYPDERRYQVADTVSWAHGNHFFKWGGDVNRVDDELDNLFQEGGVYSFNSRGDFIADWVSPALKCGTTSTQRSCYSSFAQGFGPSKFEFRTWDYNFFVQDDWRIHPRLTVSLGLRYEYQALPDPQLPNPDAPLTAQFPTDKNNIGPRIGFAFDVFGDGKSSLRGGYGMYYGRIINSTISNAITNTGVPEGQVQLSGVTPSTPGAPVYPNVLATGGAAGRDIVMFSPNAQNPQIHQTDLVFEREFAPNTMFSVSYLGSFGRQLPTFIDRNLPLPSGSITYTVAGGELDGNQYTFPLFTGVRPNANFAKMTNIETAVNSYYHAMVAQVNRRMTKGLQFQANYTWSHAIDTGQSSQTFTTGNAVFDAYDLAGERGSSNFDLRHRFVASVVWAPEYFRDNGPLLKALLDGWTVSPIVSLASGRVFTPTVSGSAPLSAATSSNPNGRTSSGINGSDGSSRVPFVARNGFNFPWSSNIDLRLSRRIPIMERYKLEFFAEAFNLFNHVNYTAISSRMFTAGGSSAAPTLTYDSNFGNFTAAGNTIFRERQVQLAVRFEF